MLLVIVTQDVEGCVGKHLMATFLACGVGCMTSVVGTMRLFRTIKMEAKTANTGIRSRSGPRFIGGLCSAVIVGMLIFRTSTCVISRIVCATRLCNL